MLEGLTMRGSRIEHKLTRHSGLTRRNAKRIGTTYYV